jgi:hypothetical protein
MVLIDFLSHHGTPEFPSHLTFLMVSLPELTNGQRYWPKIWYGDSTWKIGGPHTSLPIGECPKITSIK